MHEEPFYAHFMTKQIYSSVPAANEHQTRQSIVKREFKLYDGSHLKLVLPTLVWKPPDKDIHSLMGVGLQLPVGYSPHSHALFSQR
jgi:hypothetical protein